MLLLLCFVYKPSKTSWGCTSDHNILISQLCSLGCFNQRVFDQNCSDTTSLPWLWTPMQWFPPGRMLFSTELSITEQRNCLLLSKTDLIRRLPAPYEVKCWTLLQQPGLKMLQQPRKGKGLTDAIQIQRVAGRCAVFQAQTVGLHH